MPKWSLKKIEACWAGRLAELQRLATLGDPWVFVAAASAIEYLAQWAMNKETTQDDYKQFLRDRFFTVCPSYATFTYDSGKQDIDVQMDHVLRCGAIHSFSLIAGTKAKTKGGRDRSIILTHPDPRWKQLDNYVNRRRRPPIDAAVFVANDFVCDIANGGTALFTSASTGNAACRALKSNIIARFNAVPPIGMLLL
jgi:hypothetical protein